MYESFFITNKQQNPNQSPLPRVTLRFSRRMGAGVVRHQDPPAGENVRPAHLSTRPVSPEQRDAQPDRVEHVPTVPLHVQGVHGLEPRGVHRVPVRLHQARPVLHPGPGQSGAAGQSVSLRLGGATLRTRHRALSHRLLHLASTRQRLLLLG